MRIKKVISILIILLMISAFAINCAYGAGSAISSFKGASNNDVKTVSQAVIKTVLAYVRYAAAAVAVIILLIIGIKYMTAASGERADIKKYAVNYVTGAIIMFAAAGIVDILAKILK